MLRLLLNPFCSLINRFLRDAAVLADWMGGAREMIDRLSQLSASEEVAADQWQEEYVQFVVSSFQFRTKLRRTFSPNTAEGNVLHPASRGRQISCHRLHREGRQSMTKLLLSVQALTKDLEAKSGLKAAVVRAGTQLVQLKEADGDSARNPQDLCSIESRLTQMELDWSSLQSDVPVVQENLHKVRFCPFTWKERLAGSVC